MGMHGFQFYTIIRNGNCECCKQAWLLYSYVRLVAFIILWSNCVKFAVIERNNFCSELCICI